ncbi:MAG: hypothetical protein MHM6MM_009044, partial [Cercozoa sp. M6MM]
MRNDSAKYRRERRRLRQYRSRGGVLYTAMPRQPTPLASLVQPLHHRDCIVSVAPMLVQQAMAQEQSRGLFASGTARQCAQAKQLWSIPVLLGGPAEMQSTGVDTGKL